MIVDPPRDDGAAVQVDGAGRVVAAVENHDWGCHDLQKNTQTRTRTTLHKKNRTNTENVFAGKIVLRLCGRRLEFFFCVDLTGNVVYRYRLFIKNFKKFCIT